MLFIRPGGLQQPAEVLGTVEQHGLGRRELGDPAPLAEAVARAIDVATLTVQQVGADPPRRSEVGWPPL